MDRTFLGGMKLSSRISLFVLIGIGCLVAGGFGLFRAQQDLGEAQRQVTASYELAKLVDTVEATAWRLRAEGIAKKQTGTAQSTEAMEAHITKAIELGRLLDDMYSRFDTATPGEHITTVREALAQYAEAYGALASGPQAPPAADTTALFTAVQGARNNLQARLDQVNILSLNKTIADMRDAEVAFMKHGQTAALIAIGDAQDGFLRLLSMVPLSETDAADLRKLMLIYQHRMTKYANGKLSTPDKSRRLDEIFSYMTPSIDSLQASADQQLTASILNNTTRQDLYHPLIALVGAGLMLLVLLSGALILRSVTAPVSTAAEAGRRIANGETNVVVWGLGNDDETGDVARALSVLKLRLGEIVAVRENMEKAKSEAERGRAATEEAAWLRHDLESMKAELAKGQAAIDEVELLHKVIEAMRSDFLENNAQAAQQVQPEPQERPDDKAAEQKNTETPNLDTISQISQQVAQSSQSVTIAAEEAERTGTLIRGLNDASKRILSIESLIKTIGDQADLLWVGAPLGEQGTPSAGDNLVMFNSDPRGDEQGTSAPHPSHPEMESSIGRRFDVIRATASQTTWALRDINGVILDARNLALAIAQTTSAEALNVTTDLLEQSENLRFMLDSLVHKMRDQLFDEGGEEGAQPGSNDLDVS